MSLFGSGAPRQTFLGQLAANVPTTVDVFIGGAVYQFQVFPLGTMLFDLPGVYVYAKLVGDNVFQAGYVGEAERLNDRAGTGCLAHHKWESVREWGATHVCVLVVGGERAKRLEIETALRHQFAPPLNDQ